MLHGAGAAAQEIGGTCLSLHHDAALDICFNASRPGRCKEAQSHSRKACMMPCMTADKLPITLCKLAHPAACTTCRWVYSRGRTQHATVALPGAGPQPVDSETAPLHKPPAAARDAACAFAALSCTIQIERTAAGGTAHAWMAENGLQIWRLLPCAWVPASRRGKHESRDQSCPHVSPGVTQRECPRFLLMYNTSQLTRRLTRRGFPAGQWAPQLPLSARSHRPGQRCRRRSRTEAAAALALLAAGAEPDQAACGPQRRHLLHKRQRQQEALLAMLNRCLQSNGSLYMLGACRAVH